MRLARGGRLYVIVLLAGLALTAAASAQPSLRWRTGEHGAYRVLLPASWRFRDASYLSDHATYLWYDPANPLRKMLVVVSGCVGCVEANFDPRRPDPRGELPQGLTAVAQLSAWKIAFSAYATDDPYPENGIVQVLSRKGSVAGSEVVQLWLPAAQHRLATEILNSFRAQG